MSDQVEMVTITKKEYEKLLATALEMSAFEAAGVDNWGGCSHAYEILAEWQEEDID